MDTDIEQVPPRSALPLLRMLHEYGPKDPVNLALLWRKHPDQVDADLATLGEGGFVETYEYGGYNLWKITHKGQRALAILASQRLTPPPDPYVSSKPKRRRWFRW